MTDKIAVGAALREIAALLTLLGENGYRAKAYGAGARAIERATDDIGELVSEGRLTELPGIGEGIASQVTALVETGASPVLEKLRAQVPKGAAELSRIEGMTLRRIRDLGDALGIDSIESLKAACEAHRVREVKGFGAKTETAMLRAIAALAHPAPTVEGTLLLHAQEDAEALLAFVRGATSVTVAAIAGDVRRWKEEVVRIDVVAASRDLERSARAIAAFPDAARSSTNDSTSVDLWLQSGAQARVHLVSPADFGVALFRETGPLEHVERVVSILRDPIEPGTTEEEVYRRAGLAFVPPELRDDPSAIDDARTEDFSDLVSADDVRGMLHCHTIYSDGRATVLEMAREAQAMGMEYVTITDHSPTAHYAGGLTVDRLRELWDEIDEAQEKVDIRILRGTESDILADGALDYPDAILEQLDVVIASVHARYRMNEDAMTKRILRAIELPIMKIWGHPLGRLVLHRPPIACRIEEILDAAARSRVAIEINGDPHRLDLPPEWIRAARSRKIPFVLSVDAHSRRGMHVLPFAIAMARRGGVRRDEVLNALSADSFARAVRPSTSEPLRRRTA